MVTSKLMSMFVSIAAALPLQSLSAGPVEPNAGNWKTWVISSGRDYRVPPPPGAADTQAELRALADLVSRNDATTEAHIFSGMPVHRLIAGSISSMHGRPEDFH